MTSYPKRHHVVPQFYLRGFALAEQLTGIHIYNGRRFSPVVERAASQNHFYRLADDYHNGPLALESAFSSVETETATIFRQILGGEWPLRFHDRRKLSFFIGVQLLRGPRYRRALMTAGTTGTHTDGSAMTATEIHARQIATLAEEWIPQLVNRPWDLVRFTTRSLITSDSPVSSIKPADFDPERWSGAPFDVATEVLFPISRKLGLRMRDKNLVSSIDGRLRAELGHFDRMEPGTVNVEKHFNRSTAETATAFLYHHPNDARFVPSEVPNYTTPLA
ncbi:DUF4238 domain-containing protein [Cryobacterium sp. TMT4-31]|uniref:DUF4238 domain-containing protein n=1 Tax=Cryobacterium sp. TMT4-31 TaxID=1259259 RepID=UPI00141BE78C|nr:DUF4238 domain-containing protein [Cryobacterium sp. TMT4-31]